MVNKQIYEAAGGREKEIVQAQLRAQSNARQAQQLGSPLGGLFGGSQQGLGMALLSAQPAFPPQQLGIFPPFQFSPAPKKENAVIKYLKRVIVEWLSDYWPLVVGGPIYMLWRVVSNG